jgi:peptidyl-prolyl cis-trans isomerase SurA
MGRLLALFFTFLFIAVPSYGKVVDFIAAVVNGEPVLYSEVVDYAKKNHIPDLRVARDKVIEKKILLTKAKSEGITVSDEELKRALSEFIKNSGFKSEKEFEEALKREGLTLSDVKEGLREQLLIAKLISREVKSRIKISNSEVEDICKKQEGKPLREVYYIYTKTSDRAERALELLKSGVPFEKVARELSEDKVTGSKGGYLGKVSPGMLIKPLDSAVWSLKPGSYKLVRTNKGFYIVYVKSEEKGHCDRNRVRRELYMRKFQKALKDYVDKLKREASVKVYM